MVHNTVRATGGIRGVKQVIGVVMAGVLAAAGIQHVASAVPEATAAAPESYNPIAQYTGFNVVAFGDLHKVAESEGPVAVGGEFSWANTQIIVKRDSEAALVVKDGINWDKSDGALQVNGTEDFVLGHHPLDVNLEGSEAFDQGSNNAKVQVHIVAEGGSYDDLTRIQLNNNSPAAAGVEYDPKWDELLDQDRATLAAGALAEQSRQECLADDWLKEVDDESAATDQEPAYWQEGDAYFVKLAADGQNIWNLSAEEFSNIGSVTFEDPKPSAANPLFVNVAGTNPEFDFNQAGADANNAPGILWNFYEAEELTHTGDSIYGSVLAPNAHFDKQAQATNVDGNVIVASGDLRGSEQHHIPFEAQFTPCDGTEPTGPETTTDPTEPTGPETTTDPTEPTDPETTTEPTEPTEPETTTVTTTVTTTETQPCDCETETVTTTVTEPAETATETVTTTVTEPGEPETETVTTTVTEPGETETEIVTTTATAPAETETETVTTTATATVTTTVTEPGDTATETVTTTVTEPAETVTETVKSTVTATKPAVTVTTTVTEPGESTPATTTATEPGEPTAVLPPSSGAGPNGSSDLGQCVANTSSVSNPVAWLIPIAMLAGVGYAMQPLVQPIIDALVGQANASIAEMTPDIPAPDFGSSLPDYGNEVAAELQSTINAINVELAKIAAGVPQEAIAVALAAVGVIAAGAAYEQCQNQGYIGHDFAQE